MRRSVNYIIVTASLFCLFASGDAIAGIKEIKPSIACEYLANIGLSTRGWKNYYDNICSCSSPYKDLGSSGPAWAPALKNNLAYYVEGTATTVRELKLVINVNDRAEAKKAHASRCQIKRGQRVACASILERSTGSVSSPSPAKRG